MVIQPILDLVSLIYQKGINDIVICPGSRSAHLSIAFKRHGAFEIKTVFDERSAAYMALGMSLATGKPTVLVCTSGTAAMNFSPAICEAFYQKVPLLVITADRPQEWIDQGDGQSIRQQNLFHNHVKRTFHLPSDFVHEDSVWAFNRMGNEAIELSITPSRGPVHLNIPIREPFYPEPEELFTFSNVRNIAFVNVMTQPKFNINSTIIDELRNKNVLLFCGQGLFDDETTKAITKACASNNIVVVAESISNMPKSIQNHDLILKDSQLENFKPEVLLTIGDAILSKSFKQFIRSKKSTISHWHIQQSHELSADTFCCLQKHFNINPIDFFNELIKHTDLSNKSFFELWKEKSESIEKKAKSLYENLNYGEFKAIYLLLKLIPEHHIVHVSNSMPIRYVNIISNNGCKIFCNRGTSGIDGSNSTAVGFALKNAQQNWLITGDMSFLYDKNAFWHPHYLNNLKILILNNSGGGIFKMIEGPSKQPELEELFVTKQKHHSFSVAHEFGFEYFSVSNDNELNELIEKLFSYSGKAILEVFSDNNTNTTIFKQFLKNFT
ncbi:MAG: 2-succinyl-5-enolpyruvyl-6-hydroxy-3-cyclohexene-1-carboxylic-acid synthase [Cytophagales bacterium]